MSGVNGSLPPAQSCSMGRSASHKQLQRPSAKTYHSSNRRISHSIRLLVFVAVITGALAAAQTDARPHAKRAKNLNDIIEHVNITDGLESIGGASIEDATNVLREKVAFPVALEMIEFDRPKDFITLDEALAKLHCMQTVGVLGARDKGRLGTYEEMAQTRPGSEVLVPRQKAFTLIRNQITVRDLFDEITRLDDKYEWKNYGTDNAPLIVIQPRTAAALDWKVSPICKTQPTGIDELLAGCNGQECGSYIKLLSDHNISVIYMSMGPVSPDKPAPDLRPHGFIDLCSHSLTARDVLNRIAKSSRTSWTLGGIKGMRLISFAPIRSK